MKISLPELSLVFLVGPSSSGKSTFAQKYFQPTEVVSSEACRLLISDDKNNKDIAKDAFELLYNIAAKRLKVGRLTVIDAANLRPESRIPLLALARKYHFAPIAIVFHLPEEICQTRNKQRSDRQVAPQMIHQQSNLLRYLFRYLKREGFASIYQFFSPEEVEKIELHRQSTRINLRNETGPFDIIGDIHGCFDELHLLLTKLGYEITQASEPKGLGHYKIQNAPARKIIFLGDLVDRGPKIPEVLRLVIDLVKSGHALAVPGNHEKKLVQKLKGRDVQLSYGLEESLRQLKSQSAEFIQEIITFVEGLTSHYVLDEARLVVAHAGLKESMHGRSSPEERLFALYGESPKKGSNYRGARQGNWIQEYHGKAMVVYGHTPVAEPFWINRTLCVDTGCVFGGNLSALRYPEKEVVSVKALKTYCYPPKKFLMQLQKAAHRLGKVYEPPPSLAPRDEEDIVPVPIEEESLSVASKKNVSEAEVEESSFPSTEEEQSSEDSISPEETTEEEFSEDTSDTSPPLEEEVAEKPRERTDTFLDIEDVLGRRHIKTKLLPHILIHEESAIASLEILNRFAVPPEWLIYLPISLSPTLPSRTRPYLEYPQEAFHYYSRAGLTQVICEEFHAGSQVVVILCRNSTVAENRFKTAPGEIGVCYNRIGQRVFSKSWEKTILTHFIQILDQQNFWQEFQTDWVCFEAVLSPKNFRQEELFATNYAKRSYATEFLYTKVIDSLSQSEKQGARVQGLIKYYEERKYLGENDVTLYSKYFWPVSRIQDLKIAPVHLLATQGKNYFAQEHLWQLRVFESWIKAEEQLASDLRLLKNTSYKIVALNDSEAILKAIEEWESETHAGWVIKPPTFLPQGNYPRLQPALKCRRPGYLKLHYGPEYGLPKNLRRLKIRNLSPFRMHVLKTFALSTEALDRFVQNRPHGDTHECIAGVLALESEPLSAIF